MIKVQELTVKDVKKNLSRYILVDVREPHELLGPEGQIEKTILAPMGPHLLEFLRSADPSHEYVFICRSGYRSAQACEIAYTYGVQKAYNMKGGILAWKGKGFPIS